MERNRMRKNKIIAMALGGVLGISICACNSSKNSISTNTEEQPSAEITPTESISWDNKEINIQDLKKEYKLIVVNDQHIIVPDGDYISEKSEEIEQRVAMFSNSDGNGAARGAGSELPQAAGVRRPT